MLGDAALDDRQRPFPIHAVVGEQVRRRRLEREPPDRARDRFPVGDRAFPALE